MTKCVPIRLNYTLITMALTVLFKFSVIFFKVFFFWSGNLCVPFQLLTWKFSRHVLMAFWWTSFVDCWLTIFLNRFFDTHIFDQIFVTHIFCWSFHLFIFCFIFSYKSCSAINIGVHAANYAPRHTIRTISWLSMLILSLQTCARWN